MINDKPFWVSIKKAEDCLFSRRNGYKGRIIFGYSVCIRLFGKNILRSKKEREFIKEAKRLHITTVGEIDPSSVNPYMKIKQENVKPLTREENEKLDGVKHINLFP